jgi:ketosteroid isomerase-like protein
MTDSLGERFARALARRDADALTTILAPDVDFRGLTPSSFWEGTTAGDVVGVLLGKWFEESDHVDDVAGVETGADVEDTHRVGYRFHVTNPDGRAVVEQQAYYRVNGGRISHLRIVCSGFRPCDR